MRRWYLSLPDNDPRFDGLRQYLGAIQQRGHASPVPRILAEYALLGFLLTTGQIAGGTGGPLPTPPVPEDVLDPQQTQAVLQDVQDALTAFRFD